jgi:hypothetical protein
MNWSFSGKSLPESHTRRLDSVNLASGIMFRFIA